MLRIILLNTESLYQTAIALYADVKESLLTPLIVIRHLYEDIHTFSEVVLQSNTWPSSAGKCKVKVSAISEMQR